MREPGTGSTGRRGWWPPVAALIALTVLTVLVVADFAPLVGADRGVRDAAADAARAASWLDAPMRLAADLGGPVPGAVALVAAGILLITRGPRGPSRWRPLVVAACAAAVVGIAVVAGKIAVGRHGPGEAAPAEGQWGWFPSGHTATSAICFGLAALLVGLAVPRAGRAAAGTAVVVCAAVGVALVWCGYHWLSDVVASWALCAAVLWVAARLVRP